MGTDVLNDLLEAEKSINERVEAAKKRAEQIVKDAENSSREEIGKMKKELEEKHRKQVEQIILKISEKKKQGIEDTKKVVAAIKSRAEKAGGKAIDKVYNEFFRVLW